VKSRRIAHQPAVLAALVLLTCGVSAAARAPRYAIRAGKVITVTNGAIDDAIVLVRKGKIEAVGPSDEVRTPRGYREIDASGLWLMPGMVEVHSHAGVAGGINDMVSQTNAGMRIGDGVDPESEIIRKVMHAGVTTLQVVPGSGTNHSGFGVTFKTAGGTKRERLIRRVGVLKIAQADNPERRAGDIGATLMGMTWILRDHLDRAQSYDADRPGNGKRNAARRDLALEQTRPALRGEIPILIHTWQTWGMTMTVHMFHDELGLPNAFASHATGAGHLTATEVARRDCRVDIGPRVVDFYGRADGHCYGIVPSYRQAGVEKISVNTDAFGFAQAYLATKAAMAARFGLDDAEALELMTINAARALLLDDRLGSIEVGKDADLVVKASSLLDPTTPVEMVFVNGRLEYTREANR